MIEFRNVCKRYGPQDVLLDVSVQINASERVGIVGPNGGGKSTMFALIERTLEPDKGEIFLPKKHRIGHVHQQIAAHAKEASLLAYTECSIAGLEEIVSQITSLEGELSHAEPAQRNALVHRLGELQSEFEHLGGYEMQSRAEAALGGLGFSPDEFERPFREFSGGWQMRAELARTVIGQPDTLMLDEPSNYLDVPAIEWLRRFLRGYAGTLMLISHDRYLLESLTEVTLEVQGGQVTRYAGGYEYYVRERDARREQLIATHKTQERKREQMQQFVDRFRAKNTKSAQVQSRIKMIEKMESVEIPVEISNVPRIRIAPPPHCGAEIIRLEGAGHSYDGEHWVLRDVDLTVSRGQKVALVGYNGMGKTTLLRVMADHLQPSRGKRVLGHHVRVGYQAQDPSETMPPDRSVFGVVRAVSDDASDKDVWSILGNFGFSGDAVEKPCGVLSGGEKIRLAFARIFIQPPNFLILDEPTTHLDLNGRRALEAALLDYKGTICMVSHDITFLRNVADRIIAMAPPSVKSYAGGYDYYCEKMDGLDAPAPSAVSPAPKSAAPKVDRKAQRKDRAADREALRSRQRDLKRAVRKAEQDIEKLEREQSELVTQLETCGELDFEGVNRRLQHIQAELEIESDRWEKALQALEETR